MDPFNYTSSLNCTLPTNSYAGINFTSTDIVTIVSTLGSVLPALAVGTYCAMKVWFRDIQKTKVSVSTTTGNKTATTTLIIEFENDEKFEITKEHKTAQNSQPPSNKDITNNLPNMKDDSLQESTTEAKGSTLGHTSSFGVVREMFSNALSNNHDGDVIIGDGRKYVVAQGCKTFLMTVSNGQLDTQHIHDLFPTPRSVNNSLIQRNDTIIEMAGMGGINADFDSTEHL